jgi:hypothetical protein
MYENIDTARLGLGTLNPSELALLLLEWEKAKRALNELEAYIARSVLNLGKTQNVGNVRATYSEGRRKLDYETPGSKAPAGIIELHSEVESYVDWEGLARSFEPTDILIFEYTHAEKVIAWNKVCKDAGIEPDVVKQGEPSVTLKLME